VGTPGCPIEPSDGLSLSDLVALTGVPASTIHHYRRNGLIPPPERAATNRFAYNQGHVEALLRLRQQAAVEGEADHRERIVAAAIEAFKTRSYAEVTVNEIAEAAGVAKGSVYRYFESKEDLLTASIEALLEKTTQRFDVAVHQLGSLEGYVSDPDKAALVFGYLVADVLPMLLELGARAAKGHEPSAELGRRVLRRLALTVGQPFVASAGVPERDPCQASHEDLSRDPAVEAGLKVIVSAFATVMTWAVGVDWPPDHLAGDAALLNP